MRFGRKPDGRCTRNGSADAERLENRRGKCLVFSHCLCYIIEKGKPEKRLPLTVYCITLYKVSRQLLRIVGGYFFPLKIV
jgi:hypothetical protein